LGPSSPDIVRAIASSSIESRPLILYIIQALAKASAPAPLPRALVNACETLALESAKKDSNLSDAYTEVALVFGSIGKDKAKELLPKLVDVPSPSAFVCAVASLQNSNLEARASATDILVALHELDIRTTDTTGGNDNAKKKNNTGVSLKSLVDVCNTCFSAEATDYFTSSAVASALSHMVDRTPLPKLFMRTAMLAETAHPSLKEFSLELLEKLAKRKVWTMDRGVWEGFARSVKKAAPRSFPVLATLPADKTKEILDKFGKNLRAPLKAYAEATGAKNLLEALEE
jgi:symplekin